MWLARCNELLALLAIGDGVTAIVQPRRHMRLWARGPRCWERAMQPFVDNPTLARVAGAAEVAAGLWWASRQRASDG